MIGKVMRGSDVAGLLRYLYGPGRANEHTAPHLVAAWDPARSGLEPGRLAGSRHDVRHLAGLLRQPVAAAVRTPSRPVWHCAVRTAPGDRRLTDTEWADIARDIVARTGFAPAGDDGSCRWVAVRHADDHIHLVVTLARQDGRAARASNDFYRVGEACRAAESRLGLRRTPPRDRTAGPRPTRAESEKATRAQRREPPRLALQRHVRAAAAAAGTPQEFLQRLHEAGVLVRERRSELDPGEVTGYAVALPGDRAGDGRPVWFGGGKLAPELSWPRLAARWPDTTGRERRPGAGPSRLSGHARQDAWRSATATATATAGRTAMGAPDIPAATADLLAATARLVDGQRGGHLTDAADTFARAARQPYARAPPPTGAGRALRAMARTLTLLGRTGPDETADVLALLAALMELTAAVARARQAQNQLEQAAAALATRHLLRAAEHDLRRQPPVVHTPRDRGAVHSPARSVPETHRSSGR